MKRDEVVKAITAKAKAVAPKGSEVILFGSQARRDAHEGSDWDVLVLLNKSRVTPADIDEVAYPLRELGWDFGATVNTVLYTQDEWQHEMATPFYENVTRDGIRL